jgi:hypothetical protein
MVNAIYASYGPALAFPANPEGQPGHLRPVNRVDNVYGDRHLLCTCPPMKSYNSEGRGEGRR